MIKEKLIKTFIFIVLTVLSLTISTCERKPKIETTRVTVKCFNQFGDSVEDVNLVLGNKVPSKEGQLYIFDFNDQNESKNSEALTLKQNDGKYILLSPSSIEVIKNENTLTPVYLIEKNQIIVNVLNGNTPADDVDVNMRGSIEGNIIHKAKTENGRAVFYIDPENVGPFYFDASLLEQTKRDSITSNKNDTTLTLQIITTYIRNDPEPDPDKDEKPQTPLPDVLVSLKITTGDYWHTIISPQVKGQSVEKRSRTIELSNKVKNIKIKLADNQTGSFKVDLTSGTNGTKFRLVCNFDDRIYSLENEDSSTYIYNNSKF